MQRFTLFLFLALLLAACNYPASPAAGQPTTAVTGEPVLATPSPSPEPLATVEPVDPTAVQPTAGSPAHPLAGLIVTRGAGQGLGSFDAAGTLQPLSQRPFAALSPDGAQIAYIEGDDVWLEPVDGSAAPINLTNSPTVLELSVQWWPARPGWLLVAYQPADDIEYSAFFGLVKSDGSEFVPLEDQESSMSTPAMSPDGSTIAYDRLGQPALINVDSGEKMALSLDVPGHPVQMMAFPAWAPDGRSLVYKLYDQQGWIGTGLYDLASSTWRLVQEYMIVGGTEPYAEFAFSPDGRWLAMVNQSDPAVGGFRGPALWVLPLNGGDPVLLGAGNSPVWSPDSTRLVFTQASGGSFDQDMLQLVLAESWEPVQLGDLPGGYYAQDWR